MKLRASYLPSRSLNSIYIGGGTPSQLSVQELGAILNTAQQEFDLADDAEITLEVNPDDLTKEFVLGIKEISINRVSMGVQSFHDEFLSLLNRRHTANEARDGVALLNANGITNISIDLIYGLPAQNIKQWADDINAALELPIRHLSAYALTYEEGTALWKMRESGQISECPEELSLEMFQLLMKRTKDAGFEHYEISNFSHVGFRARHNSGYWHDMFYLGLGPGAHSYNGESRQWNVPELKRYLQVQGDVTLHELCEVEELTPSMRFNETLLKNLRTLEGLNLKLVEQRFGSEQAEELFRSSQQFIKKGLLAFDSGTKQLRLTQDGIFVSDGIISDLMVTP